MKRLHHHYLVFTICREPR